MDFTVKIVANELINKFNLKFFGDKNHVITNVGTLTKTGKNFISWAKNTTILKSKLYGVVVCTDENFKNIKPIIGVTYLLTDENPRLIFAKILHKYFSSKIIDDFTNHVDYHRKNSNIKIGENVFIGKNVLIGNNTLIYHNVTINSNTIIGDNCILRVNSSIGTEGLGLEYDPKKKSYIKFPQIGGVIIRDEVEVGPSTTIRRSALDNTEIDRGTKIGSLCNIGHNCKIGVNCIITSNVIISGSSTIGNNVFMGIGSTVKQGINIGNYSTIGQGTVVLKNIPKNQTWIGNPAIKL